MSGKPVIGVVGLGTMGLGIAQLFAQAGHSVIATDSAGTSRESARARLQESLRPRIEAAKMTATEGSQVLQRIQICDKLAAFAPAAMVIEAIIENLQVKQALFSGLEDLVSRDCVLATNTSALSVAAIAQVLKNKRRFLGLHFFNPVPGMKLVELVATADTCIDAIALAREITAATGKTVITCADTPGFIVNRCARPFYGEALCMLEEGRSASDIDAAMLQAGYRLGPFSLIDLVGADINLAATESLYAAMNRHPRYHVFEALRRQVASGRLGRKSGEGFLFPSKPGQPPADASGIALRIAAVMANEAATLARQAGLKPEDIDTAMKLGLNLPRGPCEAARDHGVQTITRILDELEAKAPEYLKGRYKNEIGVFL